MKMLMQSGLVLRQVPLPRLIALGGAMVAMSLTEGVSLVLLVPILELLSQGTSESMISQVMARGTAWLGLPLNLGTLVSLFVVLVGVRSALQVMRDRLAFSVHALAIDKLRLTCLRGLMEARWHWLVNRKRSDHAALVTLEISRIGGGIQALVSLVATTVGLAAYMIAAFAISPAMSALTLATGMVIYLSLYRVRRRAVLLGSDLLTANKSLMATVERSLWGLKLAKILGTEERHLTDLHDTMASVRKTQLTFNSSNALARAFWQFLGAALLGVYVMAGVYWLKVDMPVLIALVFAFSRMLPGLMAVQQSVNQWLHTAPLIDHVQQFLDESLLAADRPIGTSEPFRDIHDAVRLDHVTLAYDSRPEPSVKDVSLVIPARATTAIIGASGAGKSTLADILVGLLGPDTGTLRVDDMVIGPEQQRNWMRSVAYIPQDVTLYHDTVRRNLLWGAPEATDAEIHAALARSAAEFVHDLPNGLDTIVGDGGALLSGGERQRLAIARALLRKVPMLVLDEATSALDVENEARIHDALAGLHGELTIVMIGHRLPMLELADQIVEMNAGRIVSRTPGPRTRNA